jgi:hypothetical protein
MGLESDVKRSLCEQSMDAYYRAAHAGGRTWTGEGKEKKKEKTTQAVRKYHSPHQLRKRSHFGTGYRKTPPPKGKEKINGDQEGCRLNMKPAPDND